MPQLPGNPSVVTLLYLVGILVAFHVIRSMLGR